MSQEASPTPVVEEGNNFFWILLTFCPLPGLSRGAYRARQAGTAGRPGPGGKPRQSEGG